MRAPVLLVVFAACSPTVQGKALTLSGSPRRVAVAGAVKDAYTQGVEHALMSLAQGKLTLLSRNEQTALGQEKELQYSGDFSDEAMVGLGKQLGAELLFVVKDETRKTERPAQANVEDCDFKYGDGAFDDDAKKRSNAESRKQCEARNKDERDRAAKLPPQVFYNYRSNVRVVDVATGEILAFGDADVGDGQAGMMCVFPCTKDKAAELAVKAILGITEK